MAIYIYTNIERKLPTLKNYVYVYRDTMHVESTIIYKFFCF